jgi:hypothetical protein
MVGRVGLSSVWREDVVDALREGLPAVQALREQGPFGTATEVIGSVKTNEEHDLAEVHSS